MSIWQSGLVAIFAYVSFIALGAAIGLLIAWPVMWCWNYTIPHLFGLPTITWGQAWCLAFVANRLIRGGQMTTFVKS